MLIIAGMGGAVYSIVRPARTGNNHDLIPQLTVIAVVACAVGIAVWLASPAPRTGYFLVTSTKTFAVTGLIVLGAGLPRLVVSNDPWWDLAVALGVAVVLGILAAVLLRRRIDREIPDSPEGL